MFWLLTVLILLGGAACQDAVGISGNHVGELISLISFNLFNYTAETACLTIVKTPRTQSKHHVICLLILKIYILFSS